MITRARRILARLFRASPRRPVPIGITWGGLNAGEVPYVDIRYALNGSDAGSVCRLFKEIL